MYDSDRAFYSAFVLSVSGIFGYLAYRGKANPKPTIATAVQQAVNPH